jgi:hypothetical protein
MDCQILHSIKGCRPILGAAELRQFDNGAAVNRSVLGWHERGAAPAGYRELWHYISAMFADRFDSYAGQKLDNWT